MLMRVEGAAASGKALRSLTALLLGGVVLEAGCLWIVTWSPQLTAQYTPDFTREFFSRLPWLQVPLGVELIDVSSIVAVLEIGLLTMIAGYIVALVALSRPLMACTAQVLLGCTMVFRLTLFLLPGLFSTDVFSYVMTGRIAAVYGGNPYVAVPADFPADSFLGWVFPFWRDAPTVYGPAWTDFSWALAELTAGWPNFDQVLAYRFTLMAMDSLTLLLVWRLLRRIFPGDASRQARLMAFGVFAWNPLLLFDLVGNQHNDVAMVLLMLLALTLVHGDRPVTGLAAMVASTLVKYTTGVAVLFWTVGWISRANTASARLSRTLAAAATGLILVVPLVLPWLQTPALILFKQAAGGRLVINSVPDLLALTLADQLLVASGSDKYVAEDSVRSWFRVVSWLGFAVYLSWETWRIWRWRSSQSDGSELEFVRMFTSSTVRALLILPLLVMPAVWSWYFSWSLGPSVLLGWDTWLTRLVVMYSLAALPFVYAHQYLGDDVLGVFVLLFALGPVAAWLVWYGLAARGRGNVQAF